MSFRLTFVCTGNICRSPMAEAIARQWADKEGLDVDVDSSGTGSWHVGDDADPRTVETLRLAGYASNHTARQFDPADFTDCDLIVAMDSGHLRALRRLAPDAETQAKVRLLRDFDPAAGDDLNVPDPYYDDAEFSCVRELIEAAMPGLFDEIRRREQ
ncbi:MAG: low molecular weight phosphotyrosine protein phosphatase [Mycobacteriaceae bacterium]|nr:low molecular weight phosphotyrosine protein phosphatase [Mycobacteriaceae bacterium]